MDIIFAFIRTYKLYGTVLRRKKRPVVRSGVSTPELEGRPEDGVDLRMEGRTHEAWKARRPWVGPWLG